jgi:hypothetical protein
MSAVVTASPRREEPLKRLRYLAVAALLLSAIHVHPALATGSDAPPMKLVFNSLVGGDYEYASVKLSQPAPKDLKVEVMSTGKAATIAPLIAASLEIAANQTSVPFLIVSSPVKTPQQIAIVACAPSPSPYPCPNKPAPGMLEAEATLELYANGPASVTLTPAAVSAGSAATGLVQLKYPAPKNVVYYKNIAPFPQPKQYVKTLRQGGAVLTLTGSAGVNVPASIPVSPGASSAPFTAATSASAASVPQPSSCVMGPSATSLTITAKWEQTASGALEVLPSSASKSRYTSNTIRIDPASIVGISHDGQVLVLESTQCTRMLKKGSVMFINGLGVLDVGKVKTFTANPTFISLLPHGQSAAAGIAVGVSSASLTDFINDGKVQVFFQNLGPASEPGGPNGPYEEAADPNSEQPPGESPWKYTTAGDSDHFSFTAFKQNDGLSGSVIANGSISSGGYNFLAVIHGDKVQQAEFTANADVTLDVDWMAQTTAPGQGIGESRLRMRPLFSGLVDGPDGVPFLFQIDANIIFKPGFGEKAAAKGHFEFAYKGDAGIDGSSAVNEGLDATPDISSTSDSALAPNGAVIAVNAPKYVLQFSTTSFLWAAGSRHPSALSMQAADFADAFESQLAAGLSSDVKYPDPNDYFKVDRAANVSWVSSVGYAGAGMLAMLPCQQYYQTYLVNANIDEHMLGAVSGSKPPDKDLEVFKKTGVTAIPSIKGCYPHKSSP